MCWRWQSVASAGRRERTAGLVARLQDFGGFWLYR
jgi:hypothetical protein